MSYIILIKPAPDFTLWRVTDRNSTMFHSGDFTKLAIHSMPCKFLGDSAEHIVSWHMTLGHCNLRCIFSLQKLWHRITRIATEKSLTYESTHQWYQCTKDIWNFKPKRKKIRFSRLYVSSLLFVKMRITVCHFVSQKNLSGKQLDDSLLFILGLFDTHLMHGQETVIAFFQNYTCDASHLRWVWWNGLQNAL